MRITRERLKEIIKEELLQEARASAPAHRDEEEILPADAYIGEPTQKLLLRNEAGDVIAVFSGNDEAAALQHSIFADTAYTLERVEEEESS